MPNEDALLVTQCLNQVLHVQRQLLPRVVLDARGLVRPAVATIVNGNAPVAIKNNWTLTNVTPNGCMLTSSLLRSGPAGSATSTRTLGSRAEKPSTAGCGPPSQRSASSGQASLWSWKGKITRYDREKNNLNFYFKSLTCGFPIWDQVMCPAALDDLWPRRLFSIRAELFLVSRRRRGGRWRGQDRGSAARKASTFFFQDSENMHSAAIFSCKLTFPMLSHR